MLPSKRYVPVKAATTRFLAIRGTAYTYKRRIPARFHAAVGQTAWWITLRASSLQDAQIQALRLAKEHDALLASLKALPPAALLRRQVENTRGDRAKLAAVITAAVPGLSPAVQQAIEAEGGVHGLINSIGQHAVDQAVVELSGPEGVAAMALPDDVANLPPERLKAEIEELQEWQAIHRRAREDAPRLQPVARTLGLWPSEDTAPTISAAAETWLTIKPRQATTAKRIRFVVKRLTERLGDKPIDRVTTRMLVQFMDDVARLPDTAKLPNVVRQGSMSDLLAWAAAHPGHPAILPTTVNQYLSVVKALFAWAERRELAPADPAAKLERAEDQRGKSEKRRPFRRDELVRITSAARTQWGPESEDFLILLFSIYSGLRIAEVAGFMRADLRKEPDAPGWFLDLRHNRYRRLKVKDSERALPLHPEIEAAIVAHADSVPADGLLFPSMGPRIQPSVSKLSKRFGSIKRQAKIVDPLVTWHSIRHSWEDHARERIPDPGRRYLAGRKEGGSAGVYGHGPGLAQVVKWVAMLDPLQRGQVKAP